MFSLTVEKGEPAGAVFVLKEGENTLGRSRSATCRLMSQDVSGIHTRIVVEKGAARLENLSQFGTRVEGAPVTGSCELRPGQRIAVGKVTEVIFRQDASLAPGSPARLPVSAEAATGECPAAPQPAVQLRAVPAVPAVPAEPMPSPKPSPEPEREPAQTMAATRASADPGATRGAVTADDFSELTRAASGTSWGGDEEGATRAMQTRAATPEEIEHLMAVEQKRIRRRMWSGIAIAIPVLLLIIIFRPRTPPPETEIQWARDADGEYLDLFEAAPGGGSKDGGYDLCYPGNNTFKKKDMEGGMMLEGWIARNLNVPMRVIVQEGREVRFTTMDHAAAVEDWMTQAAASGGRWNFDRPSPTPSFFGRKNGIPFTRVTYLRDGDGSWFGVASVVRHGIRRIVTRIEVPATERVRAEKMMSAKLIRPSEEFEFSYWASVPVESKLAEDEVLAQVRTDLERMAPATWVALEGLLRSLLTQAVQSGHKEIETEATRLLIRLRERQALWFNSQQLAFDAAMMQNNWHKATKIAEFTKAVFSNIEDQRYFTVRKWNANPQ
jgi:hypothetical protein